MAFVIKDRVRVSTATAGTGVITLGSAVSGRFRTFAGAGVAGADTVPYLIEDGSNNWEMGIGTYSASPVTLTRTTVLGNHLGTTAAISLTGSAIVSITLGELALQYLIDKPWIFDNPKRVKALPLASGATITMDVSQRQNATLSLGHLATLNFSNMDKAIDQQGRIACVNTIANPTLALGTGLYPVGGATVPALPAAIGDKFRIDYDIVSATRADVLITSVGV